MTAHACGAFTGKKLMGCCLCCSTPVYDVREVFGPGPLEGEPSRVGLMTEEGTQVEILLSDGSVCHVDFCVPCATHLRPEDLWTVWQKNVERTDELERLAGRRDNQPPRSVRGGAGLSPPGGVRWGPQGRA